MGRPKGSKNKPKVNKQLITDVETMIDALPVKEVIEEVGFNFTPDIDVRQSKVDTKATPNSSYYQFIHPCNLEDKDGIKYRFLGIVKHGIHYSSQPFQKKEDCHALLKALIENTEVPESNKLIIN